MARSRDSKRQKKTSRLIIAIPLIALVVIAAVFFVSILPNLPAQTPPVVMNFSDQLLVYTTNLNASKDYYITPVDSANYPRAIGEPGGFWENHTWDRYGVNNNYPVYMDNSAAACPPQRACTFHIKSTVNHAYTLGDFLAVWGYPVVSLNESMGVKSSGNWEWELCTGTPGNALPSFAWGGLVLQPSMAITLVYYNTVHGFGCA